MVAPASREQAALSVVAPGPASAGRNDTAVAAWREDGRWTLALLPQRLAGDLDGLVAVLRQQPGDGGTLGLVNVEDEFFVLVRVTGGGVSLLLSDVAAALDFDLAEQVCDALDLDLPDDDGDDGDELQPAGDLTILADLGFAPMELRMIVGDEDAYADEMLASIARRLGFADAYERVVEAATR